MMSLISKIFGGNKSEKDVKKITPLVGKINEFFAQYQQLSNDQLRNKTTEFRSRIKQHLSSIDEQINSKKESAEALGAESINEKDSLYHEIDNLKKDRDKQIEEILQQLLPEAFAVMKETARRFKENSTLESSVTELDRTLAVKKDYIQVEGDKVTYKTSWKAAVEILPGTWFITMCS